MKLKELSDDQLIELVRLRLKHVSKIEPTKIKVKDKSFKYSNGVSFLISSNEFANYIFPLSLETFYPDEFQYLMDLGVVFN